MCAHPLWCAGQDEGVLENIERRVVEAAEVVARSLPGSDAHTVAAAVMDVNGNIYTGVNVFHFTGGPCAELVAVGAAAAANAGPLITIVAVGDGDRGVMAPCGRCRQVLLDLHPDVFAIVPAPDGDLLAQPIRDLLPSSYVAGHVSTAPRLVYFHARHLTSIVSGQKTATIRHREPVQPGPAVFVFDDGESVRPLVAHIDKVETRRFDQLNEDDARREALADGDALRAALCNQYPGLGDQDLVDIATFHLVEP